MMPGTMSPITTEFAGSRHLLVCICMRRHILDIILPQCSYCRFDIPNIRHTFFIALCGLIEGVDSFSHLCKVGVFSVNLPFTENICSLTLYSILAR